MKQKKTPRSQDDIDATVVAQADEDEVWGKSVVVRSRKAESVNLPAGLASRAAFVARLHRRDMAQWLAKVIEERLDVEEAAFGGAKRELRARAGKG